jgi:hypothetical protein
MKPTHATSSNWKTYMTVAVDLAEADQELLRKLQNMDGDLRWCVALWRLPEDTPTRGLNYDGAKEFIQSAGNRGRMTVELRRYEAGRQDYCQYLVGRPASPQVAPLLAKVGWQDKTVALFENEVFSAESAAEIYSYYLRHDEVPAYCTLRIVDA